MKKFWNFIKKYMNFPMFMTIIIITYLVISMALKVGKAEPAYTIDSMDVILTFLIIFCPFALGYLSSSINNKKK